MPWSLYGAAALLLAVSLAIPQPPLPDEQQTHVHAFNAGIVARDGGRLRDAVVEFHVAVDLALRHDRQGLWSPQWVAGRASFELCVMYYKLGDTAEAARHARAARRHASAAGDAEIQLLSDLNLGSYLVR